MANCAGAAEETVDVVADDERSGSRLTNGCLFRRSRRAILALMEPRAILVRGADGSERVVLDLHDYQALLDAASESQGLPGIGPIVRRLRQVLEADDANIVDLDAFLAEYDAVHGQG